MAKIAGSDFQLRRAGEQGQLMFGQRAHAAKIGQLRLQGGEGAFCLIQIKRRAEAGVDACAYQLDAGFAAGQRFGSDGQFGIVGAQGEVIAADQTGYAEADGIARILAGEQAGPRRFVAAPDTAPDVEFVGRGQRCAARVQNIR